MTTAYDASVWAAFAVAVAVASAALTGLLLVAVALSQTRIRAYPRSTGRAGLALAVLTTVLLASLFVLVPDQSRVALGVELALLGLVLGIGSVVWLSGAPTEGPGQAALVPALVALVPAATLVVGGLTVEAEAGGGLYWVLAACVAGLAGSVQSVWALLVEAAG